MTADALLTPDGCRAYVEYIHDRRPKYGKLSKTERRVIWMLLRHAIKLEREWLS